jgi:enediyne biosynthesis protein E4
MRVFVLLIICASLLFTSLLFSSGLRPYSASAKGGEVVFTDVTKPAGITFQNASAPDKKYIVESVNGGVAVFDFDQDGKLDIYLLNSQSVEAARAEKPRPAAALYRNLGNGKFEEVAARAGLADPGWAMGVSVADYDNDGDDDLYVTNLGPNRLYRNRGNGTFEDVTVTSGTGDPRFSTGSAWGDYDRDGDLDLMVANYVAFTLADLPQFGRGPLCQFKNIPVQCGPRGLNGAGDTLYRNNGNGTFTDVSMKAGVDDPPGYYGLGVVWSDLDDDGWIDIFIANDTVPNYYYHNNHDGTFTDLGLISGLAVDEAGGEQSCMGVAAGDYDRDGRLDLFVTNFSEQYNTLYHQNGDATFSDVSRASRTADVSMPYVGWGAKFIDYDNDGWLDLLVVNGHVYPQVEGAYAGGMYRQRKLFYRNLRNGTFAEIAAEAGSALLERRVSRGLATGDFDEDGDIDLIINDLDGPPMLLRNDGGERAGNWLRLKLTGSTSNRNAIGTKVTVSIGKQRQVEEVRAGDSYLSYSDRRLHFGVGAATIVDEIRLQWPTGKIETLRGIRVNQEVAIREKNDQR